MISEPTEFIDMNIIRCTTFFLNAFVNKYWFIQDYLSRFFNVSGSPLKT